MRIFTLAVAILLSASAAVRGASLDHLVLGVSDLEAGMKQFEELTGVRPDVGGKHPGAGTQNALASLGEGVYLEIIAPVADAELDPMFAGLRSLDTLTPLRWAVAVEDAAETAERLEALGHAVYGPAAGSRVRPDGGVLEWQIVALPEAPAHFPFFIDWAEGSAHPSTTSAAGCSFLTMSVTAPELDALRALLEPLALPVDLEPGPEITMSFTLDCAKGRVELGSDG